jgi:hypothetical protein
MLTTNTSTRKKTTIPKNGPPKVTRTMLKDKKLPPHDPSDKEIVHQNETTEEQQEGEEEEQEEDEDG